MTTEIIKLNEVSSNFYDDIDCCTCIDVWRTDGPNENGVVAARVFDNGFVKIEDAYLCGMPQVYNEIYIVLKELNN